MRNLFKRTLPLLCSLAIFTTSTMVAKEPQDRYSEEHIAALILKYSKRYNLDPKVIYTLVSIESAFNPFAIAVETSYKSAMTLKALRSDSIRIKVGRTYHSKIWLVSIFPKEESDAIMMISLLKSLGFGFDVGLLQINTCNFKKNEVANMIYPEYNIAKATKIFYSCTKQFRSFRHQVECYNRGAGNLRKAIRQGKNYSPYYSRFKKNWAF